MVLIIRNNISYNNKKKLAQEEYEEKEAEKKYHAGTNAGGTAKIK